MSDVGRVQAAIRCLDLLFEELLWLLSAERLGWLLCHGHGVQCVNQVCNMWKKIAGNISSRIPFSPSTVQRFSVHRDSAHSDVDRWSMCSRQQSKQAVLAWSAVRRQVVVMSVAGVLATFANASMKPILGGRLR
jgi:hypothetical protein